MKHWQSLSWMEPEQILEIARFAEELGFEGVFVSDHGIYPLELTSPYPYSPDGTPPMECSWWYPDVWTTLGAISAVTSRLRFSLTVYVLPLRNPFEVARATGTLDILSNGRLALGIGSGWMKDEFDLYGVDFATRGARMDEMLTILSGFWREGIVEFHGKHFDFPRVQISPAPGRDVPVYVGGAAPVALRRAARHDGWIGTGNTLEEVPQVLGELARHRAELGRTMAGFETFVAITTPFNDHDLLELEALGMTAMINAPFAFSLGQRSTLDAKKRNMESYARRYIA
ncbi:MAG: TIGR03619 family F420-dependent LLM class oxidoreductase [Pseudomonadales bacterium]|jgi:probable F420-dependent oxidoreductase|nr:TIGR03619 family F420-dependent LLM class oxidoreductase [Pseudomonadales bacterium]MCP5319465.1 TIGR03619 family F420-dependent LLM class oxidoreductase [Pseudomonadales bacterium]MCP5337004.1 TIGR03619 family F420-dependent LLM class oxidoreductase [Pseudomonadales bacterium]